MKEYYFASPTAAPVQVGSTGRLFKKQVLPLGEWVDPLYPEDKMTFTSEFLQRMVDNHKARVAGRVAAPSFHTDDSQYNKGEVVDVELTEDGLYAYIDIRDPETASGIENDTIWDVSAKFTDDYQDTKTGTWFGPTLLHVALVNNPYIKKMNPFQALAESLHIELGAKVRALSESQNIREEPMKVTNNRDFPVEVTLSESDEEKKVTLQPGEDVELAEDAVEGVQKQIDDAEAPKADDDVKDADEGADEADKADDAADADEDKDAKVEELSDTARELSETKRKLALRDIDDNYKQLLSEGKLVPAMEDSYKELSEALIGQTRQLSDGKTEALSEVFTRFTSSLPRIVNLDDEKGNTGEVTDKSPWTKLSNEQRERLQASGITEDKYNVNGGKNGFSVADLTDKKDK